MKQLSSDKDNILPFEHIYKIFGLESTSKTRRGLKSLAPWLMIQDHYCLDKGAGLADSKEVMQRKERLELTQGEG